ncbi:MAG: ABC transporter substrate-binding protein [bacterium]|nr:ABC transporter substrate-binding protein [bacterium]
MKGLLYALLFMMVFSPPAAAGRTAEVETLLKTKIDKVLHILNDKKLDKAVKDDLILELVNPVFDFQLIGKLSLGKKNWSRLPAERREEYYDLFTKKLQRSYLRKLDLYNGEDMIYDSPVEKGKKVHIATYLDLKENKMEIVYKFYESPKGWLIYDLEIAGVSTVTTEKSQFDGLLRDGTIDDLMAELRKKGDFSEDEEKK